MAISHWYIIFFIGIPLGPYLLKFIIYVKECIPFYCYREPYDNTLSTVSTNIFICGSYDEISDPSGAYVQDVKIKEKQGRTEDELLQMGAEPQEIETSVQEYAKHYVYKEKM